MQDATPLTVPFAVGSPEQREALLDACETVEERERGWEDEEEDSERYAGRIAAAAMLWQQLEQRSPAVDLPLVIADAIGEELAILIGLKMAEVEEGDPNEPRGLHIKQGAELMAMLVALDAALERQVMPLAA